MLSYSPWFVASFKFLVWDWNLADCFFCFTDVNFEKDQQANIVINLNDQYHVINLNDYCV